MAQGRYVERRKGAAGSCARAQHAAALGVTWDYAGGSGLQGRLTTGFRHPCSATSAVPGGCWCRAGARQRGTPHHRLLATPGRREHLTWGMLAPGCVGGGPGLTTGFRPGEGGLALGAAAQVRGMRLHLSAAWGC